MTQKTLLNIINNGGATLDKNGDSVNFKNGYQVSKKDYYILKVSNIKKILQAVNGLLKQVKKGDFVGLWVDDGKIYIDISEHIKGIKKALRVGKARQQKSIFNWSTGDCIVLA